MEGAALRAGGIHLVARTPEVDDSGTLSCKVTGRRTREDAGRAGDDDHLILEIKEAVS